MITSISCSSKLIKNYGELLTLTRQKGELEVYKENFEIIYRIKNLTEGMAILRNDLYTETPQADIQKSITDVTGPIDTAYITLSDGNLEQNLNIRETMLININEKIILLVSLSNEDILLYEGYFCDSDNKRKEDLPLRFKRLEIGNELIQLKESTTKDFIGKRFNLLKDNQNSDCLYLISQNTVFWIFVNQGKMFLHKGNEQKQVRAINLFNTPLTKNAFLQCEDNILKIGRLPKNVNFYSESPFTRKEYNIVPNKLIYYNNKIQDDECLLVGFKEWTPITFSVYSLPSQFATQGSVLLNVFGEKYKHSLCTVRLKDYSIIHEVKYEESEILNGLNLVTMKISDGMGLYLMAGISKISSEGIEAPVTGRLILYKVFFFVFLIFKD